MTLRCAKCQRFSKSRRFLEECPVCGSPRMTRVAGNPDIERGKRGNRGSKFAADRARRARRARLALEEKKRDAQRREA